MKKLIQVFSALALMASASIAQAIPVGTYQLFDHPDARHTSPTNPYGLRMDDLGYFFSVNRGDAEVFLTWNGGATASITGTLYNNQTNQLWSVSQTISMIVPDNVPSVTGFRTSDETASSQMTLTDENNNQFFYNPKANNSGFSLLMLDDDHRCGTRPDCGPIVMRGWFQASNTNDWLVQARLTTVPAPGILLLMATGLIGMGFGRKLLKR